MRNCTVEANNFLSDKQFILLCCAQHKLHLSKKNILNFSKTVQNYDQ